MARQDRVPGDLPECTVRLVQEIATNTVIDLENYTVQQRQDFDGPLD